MIFQKKKSIFNRLIWLFAVLIINSIVFLIQYPDQDINDLGAIDRDMLVRMPYDEVSDEMLYITGDRRAYDGGMRLIIPAIQVDTSIGLSTEPEDLKLQPGLYEFSQMPDEDGGNVSIAGHRDIYDQAFLRLNTLKQSDSILIIYQNMLYEYRLYDIKIIQADDWSVITRQGFSSVTLTTCEPIGTALKRLVVTGRLKEVSPYEGQYQISGYSERTSNEAKTSHTLPGARLFC